ncbi:MAG: WD40/YVTN/BNR-like repeat-containing protein [Gemmatimonadaceae bacterium]
MPIRILVRRLPGTAVLLAVLSGSGGAQGSWYETDSLAITSLRWRQIGPANMSGRVADVEGLPSPSKTFFVAAAAGGIWKTTNNGVTFRPVFDNQRVISMGDLAIAPSDTMQVWAGTGEPNSRNSISPGGGVYKSTDGGLTWRLMGLERTQAIGRIVVHPTNPNIVYVAALGAIWNANKERGLYKTTDGGTSWELVKFVSDHAGVVDVALDPSNPDVVWAASWERMRGPYFLRSGGPGSALWKSTDAGKTWTEVKGHGFPESMRGRISISIALSNPKIMYTMVEADTMPNSSKEKKAAQTRPSGLYRSEDGGVNWTKMNNENTRPFYYSQVRVHPKNPQRVYWSSTPVKVSNDGGKTPMNATVGLHVDHHAMWIDPVDPDRMIVGNDGGIGISFDQGGSYVFPNTFVIAQPYNVSFDMQVPYRVCAGLQDNGSWCAPSRRKSGVITNAMWYVVGGGDGFVTQQDPTDGNIVYSESQGGNMGRVNIATGERTALAKPNWRTVWQAWEDSIIVARGDTTVRETPAVKKRIAELKARQKADSVALDLRWNWNTPFIISPHNNATLYMGANRVMKSTRRGDEMFAISPELSWADTMKIRVSTRTTGGITPDNTGAETYGTIVSLAESALRPGVLYAGTDDGRVWSTRNDGGAWEEHTKNFPGLPSHAYVSEIEPSPHDSLTWFVTFDNHRAGDFAPYVYMTRDGGRSFASIAANLPTGGPDFAHVIKQDPVNKDLLFVGTDVGVYVSSNMGRSWQKFMTGFPTVPVNDLKIHPRERELIAATHGRGVWIVDIAPLQQLNATTVANDVHLFEPRVAFQWGEPPIEGQGPGGASYGHLWFSQPVPTYGAEITYRLTSRGNTSTRIVIQDVTGDTLRTLMGPSGLGVHKVVWDFRGKPPAPKPLSPSQKRDSIVAANRRAFVFDSLHKAGMDSTALRNFRRMLEGGDVQQMMQAFSGAFGGGAAPTPAFQGSPFNARPGEQMAAGRGGGGGGGGAMGGMAAQAGITDPNVAFQIIQAISPPGQNAFAAFQSRPQPPTMGPGEYLVTIIQNGKTVKQRLKVERASGTGASSLPF